MSWLEWDLGWIIYSGLGKGVEGSQFKIQCRQNMEFDLVDPVTLTGRKRSRKQNKCLIHMQRFQNAASDREALDLSNKKDSLLNVG